MKKICFISLGCAKNTVDSEAILALFRNDDFVFTNNPQDSDLILINTCGFIESAKEENINVILDMAKYHKKLVVMGCLVQRYEIMLKKLIPEVTMWIKFEDEYTKIPSMLQTLFDDEKINDNFSFSSRILSTDSYTAYLKISEGCDNFCSFCAIPYIRGRFVSYPLDELVSYTKKIAKEGVKEIVVIGQDPTSYGKDFKDKNINLVTLLKELSKIDGIKYIRTLYLYPNGINDELLNLIKENNKFPHYFDIPIQHASNKVLKAMNRKDTKEDMLKLFKHIKDVIPDAILRTTLIVGFPGESKKDIEELKDFMNIVKFNHLGIFTYSREEGTVSYKFKNQKQKRTKDKRRAYLMEEQAKISYELNKELIGKTYNGIVIGKDKDDYLIRCDYNSPDDIDGNVICKNIRNHNIGDDIKIKITHAFVYDLYCEEIIDK